jgi:MFS family permease
MDKNLRYSIYDGMSASVFATLTGGVFLTGFALYLGMDEFKIGLLGSMPFLVTVFQLPSSYIIEKRGDRKGVAFWAAALARLMWIPIVIAALLPALSSSAKPLIVLSLLFLSYIFIGISYVSWLSWTSDLVPENIRGSFFGTRNMLNGAAGMLTMLILGYFLDFMKGREDWGLSAAFCVIFLTAVVFGSLSLRFLKCISNVPVIRNAERASFREHISFPFKDGSFRRFLFFVAGWAFAVHIASPFFTLYFLRELKLSYGFVATLGMISALADLTGMRIWGAISDRVRNKPVIQFAGWVVAFLPLAWVTMVRPGSIVMPMVLHVIGGGFWAGVNLCMNNLLIKVAPQENKTIYLSSYNVIAGIGAATGPILAGLAIKFMGDFNLHLFGWKLLPLHVIFFTSTLMRVISLQFLRKVTEPEEVTVSQMVRILRSVRGLNVASGFNFLLHPFVEVVRGARKSSR